MLVLPVRGASGLADALTAALPAALQQAGLEAVTADADSPFVQRAVSEGLADKDDLQGSRFALAVAAGTDAALTTSVTGDAQVSAELAGSISQHAVTLTASSTVVGDQAQVARDLADQLAKDLTPDLWQRAGADAAGRVAGGKDRFTAGVAKLQAGDAKDALPDLRAALAAAPEDPGYLSAVADAEQRTGQGESALTHLQVLARLQPADLPLEVRLGDAALLAGHPDQAEAAFRAALQLRADDARAQEGLARALRARGDFDGAREQYAKLLLLLPALRDEPVSLAGLLAGQKDDSVQLATAPGDQALVRLALLYAHGGDADSALADLYRYHKGANRPAYADADYLYLAHTLDDLARAIAQSAADLVATDKPSRPDGDAMEKALDSLHNRSDRLADVAEWIKVSPKEDAAHRYRVLAYNLLNESDYEGLLYSRTNDDAHQRRSEVLRAAALKALDSATSLEEPAA